MLLPLLALAAGCQPNIGDACKLHTDCSAAGDRICEPNLPGGYCTMFNCEPGSCPSEALCVAYGSSPSAECTSSLDRRLQRTFCMKSCSTNADCDRSGYACVDIGPGSAENPWGAVVVDRVSQHKICTAPASGSPAATGSPQVCAPPLDASFPPVPTPDGAVPPDAAPVDASMGPDAATPDAAPADGGRAPRDSGAGRSDAAARDGARDGAGP